MFYLKIAWNNLKNAIKAYAPFVLASLILYSLTCSTLLILTSPMREDMGSAALILPLGVFVLALLSLIMEIYSYNILLKQRSKEFGLYNILGMKKSQVGWIATLELGIIFLIVVVLGSLFSAVLSNLLYLVFVNLINYDKLILTLSPLAFIINFILFAGIFAVLELVGLHRIKQTSPLSLFKSQEQGEKEPRGNMFLAFMGILLLGGAYLIAVLSNHISPIMIIMIFFGAVIMVVIGTYLFYISFMAWYLKRRRKNKKYFYQPKHFITTSQMIFRMKQNAAGLASITLLSVMAFVSIGTTSALYVNTQNTVNDMYPKNTQFQATTDSYDTTKTPTYTYLRQKLGDDRPIMAYTAGLIAFSLPDMNRVEITQENAANGSVDTGSVFVITQDEFRQLGNDIPELSQGEAVFANQKGDKDYKAMDLLGTHLTIVDNLKAPKFPGLITIFNGAVLVVPNVETAKTLVSAFSSTTDKMTTIPQGTANYYVDLTDKEIADLGLTNDRKVMDDNGEMIAIVSLRQAFLDDGYAIFGGMLFAGVLLGASFLMAAALIIYYKQYSEGQEDKKSYRILQEVGMSKEQVKRTISSQTLLVFFMPLVIAVIHYMFAMPMLKQMLLLFGVTSTNLIYLVAAVTIIIVVVAYYAIYRLTSRTYYRIVER